MTTIQGTVDYTDKDFEALVRRLDHLLAALFPTWTDQARANFGNILKEMFCFVGDVLCFYQDQQARETRWGTATQRASIIELAKLIGYELSGATAATVSETFTLSQALAGDLTIAAGTRVRTQVPGSPIYFQLLDDLVFSTGQTVKSATMENSETFVDTFTAAGHRDEEFTLSQTPFLDETEEFSVGGVIWTRVDNFLDSDGTDHHYIVLVDQNDRAIIRTGDGTNGAVPSPGAAVSAEYRTGGGVAGNVEASSLTKILGGPFFDSLGNVASISVNNGAAASGGSARETVEQAKALAPRSLRVQNRCIARTDFEDLALQVTGVVRALMLTINEYGSVPEGYGWLYLYPLGGGNPSPTLIAAVRSFIDDNYPTPLNMVWDIRTTTLYATVDIEVWVYKERGYTNTQVVTNIRNALTSFFRPINADLTPNTDLDWGYYYQDFNGVPDATLPWSDVFNVIRDSAGIRRIGTAHDSQGMEINGGDDDMALAVNEFPYPGNIVIHDGDNAGATIYDGVITSTPGGGDL